MLNSVFNGQSFQKIAVTGGGHLKQQVLYHRKCVLNKAAIY